MPRILDYYGAREAGRERISDLISQATGLVFQHRENSFIGAYYKATGAERGPGRPRGQAPRLRGSPWQRLNLRPEPHGHRSLRPTRAKSVPPPDSV
jgi:hypothetical protein